MLKKCQGCRQAIFEGSEQAAAGWCRTGGKCPKMPEWITRWKAIHRDGYEVDMAVVVQAVSAKQARDEAGNFLLSHKLTFVSAVKA